VPCGGGGVCPLHENREQPLDACRAHHLMAACIWCGYSQLQPSLLPPPMHSRPSKPCDELLDGAKCGHYWQFGALQVQPNGPPVQACIKCRLPQPTDSLQCTKCDCWCRQDASGKAGLTSCCCSHRKLKHTYGYTRHSNQRRSGCHPHTGLSRRHRGSRSIALRAHQAGTCRLPYHHRLQHGQHADRFLVLPRIHLKAGGSVRQCGQLQQYKMRAASQTCISQLYRSHAVTPPPPPPQPPCR
jgi:hypothetical protein